MPQHILTVAQYNAMLDILGAAIPFSGTGTVALTNGVSYRAISYSFSGEFMPATTAENVSAPEILSSGYANGWVRIVNGAWEAGASVIQSIQISDDGVSGWTETVTAIDDDAIGRKTVSASAAGKYLRVAEALVGDPGSVVYSAAAGPFAVPDTHVLSTMGNQNALRHTITPPIAGATLANGFWVAAKAYYNGLTWGSALFSIGNPASTLWDIHMHLDAAYSSASGGSMGTSSRQPPVETGWHLVAMWFRSPTTTRQLTHYRNAEAPLTATGTGGSYTLSESQWSTISIGSRVTSSGLTTQTDVPIDGLCIGNGDPSAMLEWVYNNGDLRRIEDYDFDADPNCSLTNALPMTRTGAPAFDASQIVDTVGSLNSWTHLNSLASFSWVERYPSYVVPWGNIVPVPAAYLSPAYGTTEDEFSIETGRFGRALSATEWAPSTIYGSGARATNSGTTYMATEPHTSGASFAADLSAGKWAVFSMTINSLTHSVLGDISASVSPDYTFTCTTPGIITGSITVGGATETVTAEVRAAAEMPAIPALASAFGGNGLMAAIEPYPTPAAAATAYADVAALNAAIGAMTAGSTLVVDNLDDLMGTVDMRPPARDYGGATVICKNWLGVKVKAINLGGCQNLTLVGFAARGAIFSSTAMGGSITIDHCRCANFDVSGNEVTTRFTFTNHASWDPAVDGLPSGYTRFTRLGRVTGIRWIMAGMQNSVAVFQMYLVGTAIFDRFYAHPGSYYGTDHPDIIQLTKHTSKGYMDGDMRNGFGFHRKVDPAEYGMQGLFLTDNALRNLSIKNVIMDTSLGNSFSLAGSRQNVRLENCLANNLMSITSGYQNAAYARDNIRGSAGPVMLSARGWEIGTVSRTDLGLSMGDIYPQYAAYEGSWRAYVGQNPAYSGKGPAAMIAELEAKRVELGL